MIQPLWIIEQLQTMSQRVLIPVQEKLFIQNYLVNGSAAYAQIHPAQVQPCEEYDLAPEVETTLPVTSTSIPSTTEAPTTVPRSTTSPEPKTTQVFESLSADITPGLATCGSGNGAQRIVGGTDAVTNSWPWIVFMLFQTQALVDNGLNGGYRCGGTAVNDHWVLTAAHCCHNMVKVTMKFGETDLASTEAGEFEIIVDDPTAFYLHED